MAGGSKIWTVRGIPAELQSAVSGAAKAARLTLGEWTASALTHALAGDGPGGAPSPDTEVVAARVEGVETRLAVLERRLEGLDSRTEGTQFRVDGLEHRAEGMEGRISTLLQRLDSLDRTAVEKAALSRGPTAPVAPPPVAPSATAPRRAEEGEERPGPFTRGIGSRKRLTAAGEEELQRLLTAGVDDAAIAARLGIHKRIVWARRLTESVD